MHPKPGYDAIGMVCVLAGHLPCLLPDDKVLLADGALRPNHQMGLPDGHHWHGVDGRRRSRRLTRAVVLGQLVDQIAQAGPSIVVPRVDCRRCGAVDLLGWLGVAGSGDHERSGGGGHVDLVEELAEATGAEGDLEGRRGDDTDGALALVAPEQSAVSRQAKGHD